MAIDYLMQAKNHQTYAPGEVIFQEGEMGQAMYSLREGQVDIIHKGRVLETLEAGALFGEMALVEDVPRSASAVARTAVRVVPVDKKLFLFLVQETPTFALEVMSEMAQRLRRMNELA